MQGCLSPWRSSQRLNSPVLPRLGHLALSWLIFALLGLILSPSCSKMAPRWPNIAQHSAKMSQHNLQEQPRTPKNLQKCSTLVVFVVFAVFGKIAPKIQKSRQDASKSAPSRPSWHPSWLSWAHLGVKFANLAPSWRQDAPQ